MHHLDAVAACVLRSPHCACECMRVPRCMPCVHQHVCMMRADQHAFDNTLPLCQVKRASAHARARSLTPSLGHLGRTEHHTQQSHHSTRVHARASPPSHAPSISLSARAAPEISIPSRCPHEPLASGAVRIGRPIQSPHSITPFNHPIQSPSSIIVSRAHGSKPTGNSKSATTHARLWC